MLRSGTWLLTDNMICRDHSLQARNIEYVSIPIFILAHMYRWELPRVVISYSCFLNAQNRLVGRYSSVKVRKSTEKEELQERDSKRKSSRLTKGQNELPSKQTQTGVTSECGRHAVTHSTPAGRLCGAGRRAGCEARGSGDERTKRRHASAAHHRARRDGRLIAERKEWVAQEGGTLNARRSGLQEWVRSGE